MQPVELNLSGMRLVLVNPGIHVSTGWAFGQLSPATPERPLAEIVAFPVHEWEKQGLKNDFEGPVFARYPEIESIKGSLYALGASYAGMTGTGSTCFGLFAQQLVPEPLSFPPGYMVKDISL